MLDQAKRDLGRQEQLIGSKATSQQELDAAAARVKVTTAGLNEAETMPGYAKVTAPFDGVITRKLADVGDLAMPGKPLMEMEAPANLRFETDLPESLLNRIKPGARLPVTIPSFPRPSRSPWMARRSISSINLPKRRMSASGWKSRARPRPRPTSC